MPSDDAPPAALGFAGFGASLSQRTPSQTTASPTLFSFPSPAPISGLQSNGPARHTGFGSLGSSNPFSLANPSSTPVPNKFSFTRTTTPASVSVAPTPATAPAVPDPAPASSPQSNGPVRHRHCYFDGDHVVLALGPGPQPSLFRIQRTILTYNSMDFYEMFEGPFESAIPGSSDDNPVRLPDDPTLFAGVLSVYYGDVYVSTYLLKFHSPRFAYICSNLHSLFSIYLD